MSADSPRRGLHKGAQVVSPQPISDRSIIDSVAGIINDIVPQAYAGAPNVDNKETITWARFEYADVNNSAFYPDYVEGSATPPLLLVLGYTTGVQVWVVAASGEATEVLSWRQWVVRTLRILPDPKTDEDNADPFHEKRPMVAICDSAGPGPQFCSVSFVSLRTGELAKSIKFKNPVCDVLANRRSVVVTFSEKIAVFDARTLEDVLTVTTCYPSPGPNPNPVALGTRWLAYSEKKLLPARRSSGGSEGEGVQSYTAAVLYAAKSLGKGLRGLGETVASSLTGNSSSPMAMNNVAGDVTQPGVVTILDLQASKEEKDMDDSSIETVVAHFTAHNDAIVAMTFDLTGALLMTADKRGHDFHVFRIQPHPGGPTLAAVHHLYVLHRGDTTAKVQDMTFSGDTRWAAVSTVRGTTHVFPVAPYGGPIGVRTHSTPHVVNRLSRFHRSAGLTDDSTRSHSPVSHAELPISVYPYTNPRLPPYPHPTILHPLAQIRQPSTLNHTNNQSQPSRPQQRQRLHSDDGGTLQLKICACFAPPRAWIYAQRDSTSKVAKRAVDSLFIMACHGNMIQYDLEPKPAAGVPKEKVCDDTTIELEVEAKGQWPLLRTPNSLEILTPLSSSSPLLSTLGSPKCSRQLDTADDRWLSQVEIVTHAGPHRRLWMGPQFIFKTYNAPSGVNLIESEAIEIGVTGGSRPARSNPVNMPHTAARPLVPLVIDGSGSSYEQSPRFMEAYGDSLENETMGIGNGENQLREDLAEAMLETSTAPHRVAGRRLVVERVGQPVTKVVNPLGTVITVMADEEDVSSSQEFDDPTPEPPRSLCAEEGPASLGDFDTERGQDLRNLTEICAEMRSASEPAIDSVPDDSIKEVRVTKTLCAEAVTVPGHHERTIDYESAEAFRDVPTSLSLCAEQGEIPNSPMTMARETNWTRRTIIRDENDLQERNYAKAKYIVNYDDDSVVLMENKATSSSSAVLQRSVVKECTRPEVAAQRTTEPEPERASKRPSKVASSTRATKRSSCATQPKYLVHEHEDSIVIEDTSTDSRSNDRPENVDERKNGSAKSASLVEATRQSPTYASAADEVETRQRRVKERRNSKNSRILEAMVVESRPLENADNFVDLEANEALVIVETRENDHEPMEATVATGLAALPLVETELRPATVISDDASCMDYHIVETGFLPIRGDTTCSQQSDDDIEHIHSSEVTQMLEILDGKLATCREDLVTHVRERKGSAISDDDMEHINGAELADDVLEQTCEREDLEDFSASNYTRASKSALSFDDDIEHVYHSEINELELPAAQGVLDSPETRVAKKKAQENASGKERSPSLRTRGSRKRKDVVVIDSDNSEAEVTVIVKSTDPWNRSKTPDKDANEDKERGCLEAKESGNEQPSLPSLQSLPSLPSLQSLPKKTRVRTPKGNATPIPPTTTNASQKRQPPDTVEIIDIDAMQKAEMEVASSIVTPECKILEARREANPPRSQKSRRSKKAHLDNNSTMMATAESLPAPEEASTSPPRVQESEDTARASWSTLREPDVAETPIEATEPRDTEAVLDVPEASKDENVERASNVAVRKSKSSESRTSSVEEKVTGTKKRGKKSRVGVIEVAVPVPINSAEELAHVVENPRDETSLPVGNAIPEPEQAISSLEVPNDVKMSDETSPGYEPREVDATSAITKNRSPEPEVQDEIEQETEKPTDSDLDGQPERSSSSDDLNANVVPMDTEEDAAVREIAEKIGPNALSPSWPTVNKKNTRSKKKKRR